MKVNFTDRALFDASQRTAISMRDGVLEYLGAEIGADEPQRLYKIYRSPATIANAAMSMQHIPVCDGHAVGAELSAGGRVESAKIIDAVDAETQSMIAVRNALSISDELSDAVAQGKRQLSLGYDADLVPHSEYDYEQINIEPHHLAIVDRARCGSMCSFIDARRGVKMADELNLEQIAELAMQLPEAIKVVPIAELQEILPVLQKIIDMAKSSGMPDASTDAPVSVDAFPTESEEDKEKKFGDRLNDHVAAMQKARQYLPDSYQYVGKTTAQIMRDAVRTQSAEHFADAELPLAFKLLQKPTASRYADFGKSTHDKYDELRDQEI